MVKLIDFYNTFCPFLKYRYLNKTARGQEYSIYIKKKTTIISLQGLTKFLKLYPFTSNSLHAYSI